MKWWCGGAGDAEERPSSGVEERVASATDLVAWQLTRTLRVAAEGKSDRERDMWEVQGSGGRGQEDVAGARDGEGRVLHMPHAAPPASHRCRHPTLSTNMATAATTTTTSMALRRRRHHHHQGCQHHRPIAATCYHPARRERERERERERGRERERENPTSRSHPCVVDLAA
jgi:hypothetical protein